MRKVPLVVATALACGLLTPVAHAARCYTWTDPRDDGAVADQPTKGTALARPDLDLLGVTWATTPTELKATAYLASLGDSPPETASYTWRFHLGAKDFAATVQRGGPGALLVDGVPQHDVAVTGTVDAANDAVTVALPRADLARLSQLALDDAVLTELSAAVRFAPADGVGNVTSYDVSAAPGTTTYPVGAVCGKLSARLRLTGPLHVQYGDQLTLGVTLTNSKGQPLARRTVAVALASLRRSLVTDARGTARLVATLKETAGRYPLKVSYAGDRNTLKTTLDATFTVDLETTRFAVSRYAGTPPGFAAGAARLTDDDRPGKPLGHHKVVVYYEGQRIGEPETNDNGVVGWAKRQQDTLRIEYAGVPGKYKAVSVTIDG